MSLENFNDNGNYFGAPSTDQCRKIFAGKNGLKEFIETMRTAWLQNGENPNSRLFKLEVQRVVDAWAQQTEIHTNNDYDRYLGAISDEEKKEWENRNSK